MHANSPSRLRLTAFAAMLCLFAGVSRSLAAIDLPPLKITQRSERALVPNHPDDPEPYLAFPALIDLGSEVLVSFKHGKSHGGSPGATLDLVKIDRATGRVTAPRAIARFGDKIMQMGEWVKFPNGDLANYIDAQQVEKPARIGMLDVRSTDGGTTFGPVERVGVIDGVEYGYPFCFTVEGNTTWMMAMSFSNLTGGYSIYAPRSEAGQVSMLRSEDSGKSWKFVRDLTREFGGVPINESSFVRCGSGFLVVTRGYDNIVRLHRTDGEFRVQQQTALTDTYEFIRGYVGRPRLFVRDGRYYLIGRNWTEKANPRQATSKDGGPAMPAAMKLCLFRLDLASVGVTAYAVLDNEAGGNVTDGYYPMPYFVERGGKSYLRVVDYKGVNRQPPQIVEFEFLWDEVR